MEVKKKILISFLVALTLLTGCKNVKGILSDKEAANCLLYTSPSPRDVEESRMPSSA